MPALPPLSNVQAHQNREVETIPLVTEQVRLHIGGRDLNLAYHWTFLR
jgi:hypothetical protein